MTHIPLHHSHYSPTNLIELRQQLKERASLVYTMFAYASMAAAKRMIKLPDGVVPGFRTSFVNRRLTDAQITGQVAGAPNRKERRRAKDMIKQHWVDVRKNEAEAKKHAAV